MKSILTGASGFVGLNLSQYLQGENLETSSLSLRDKNWKKNIDKNAHAIIHLAGKAHDTTNTSSPDEYFKVNRDLTIELFDVFLKSEIKDFFYFSSVKAVADSVEGILMEDINAKPLTPYGKSKHEAEKYLLSQTLPEGKRLFIIRPCMIHGPGNKGNLNLLYKLSEKGLPWPLAAFDNNRSFLSIDNLCYLIGHILKNKSIPSGIYNFADDKPLSTNELIGLMAKASDKKANLWKINQKLIKRMAAIGDKLHLPLNSERLKKLTESYVVSNHKIKSALGIERLPVSAEEGMLRTLKSFKKE